MAAVASAPAAGALHVIVISPETTVFEGEALGVVIPAWDGEIGILRGHAPLMAILGAGEVRITTSGGAVQKFHVEGGFAQVVENVVTVLSEKATDAA